VKPVLCIALLVAGLASAQSGPPETSAAKPLFIFRSGLWLNLHHFLYVLGRAKNGTSDSRRRAVVDAPADAARLDTAPVKDRELWDRAMAYYQKEVSPKDAVFDQDLAAMTNALGEAGDAPTLDRVPLPAAMRTALESVAAVYRKTWWERHAGANRARIDELQPLLARYGRPISNLLTKAYQQAWPAEGLTVQMSAYANWAGAYSTSKELAQNGAPGAAGNCGVPVPNGGAGYAPLCAFSRLIVMASTDPGSAGSEGLEIIFHEAMHQWDDAMISRLRETAARLHADIPRDLFHSLIFYTAGYATAQAVPGHHPYADALWGRGLPGHAQLDQYWLPYLRGEGTLQGALDRLIGAFANSSAK